MHRPHIATRVLLFAAAVCCANPSGAQDAQKLLSDPERGPLIKCYERGLDAALAEISRLSETPARYLANLALAGGPLQLSQIVRENCDQWYRDEASISSSGKEENIAAWGLLFSTYALAEHKDFLSLCRTYEVQEGDPDVAALCDIVSR